MEGSEEEWLALFLLAFCLSLFVCMYVKGREGGRLQGCCLCMRTSVHMMFAHVVRLVHLALLHVCVCERERESQPKNTDK